MSKINFRLSKLTLKHSSKPRSFYEDEARKTLNSLDKSDQNIKYFLLETVKIARDIVSDLQRHICRRINDEESSDSECVKVRGRARHCNR